MFTRSQAQDRSSGHRAALPVVMLSLATVVSAVASLNVWLRQRCISSCRWPFVRMRALHPKGMSPSPVA